ncbi:hypothetical protein [Actinophytocola sediminis]
MFSATGFAGRGVEAPCPPTPTTGAIGEDDEVPLVPAMARATGVGDGTAAVRPSAARDRRSGPAGDPAGLAVGGIAGTGAPRPPASLRRTTGPGPGRADGASAVGGILVSGSPSTPEARSPERVGGTVASCLG